jgi:uncharacterized protein (TIGR00297 family)
MIYTYGLILLIILSAMIVSVWLQKLSITGALTGGLIGFLIFLGAGYVGVLMVAVFFILGTAATSWKINLKEKSGLAESNKGRRSAGQVIANSGIAGILGFIAYLYPEYADMLRMMIAASFASATADTLSSELGNVYGRKFYNIVSLRKNQRGLNGVVSLEGTLIGIAGSSIIAIVYGFGWGWNLDVIWVIIGGTIGNLADSVLGATVERRRYINNNTVNFLNTMTAAFTAYALSTLFN